MEHTAEPVRFRPVGQNLFMVQASCLGDWERMMEQCPLLLAVLVCPYDGITKSKEVSIVYMPVLGHVMGVPNVTA